MSDLHTFDILIVGGGVIGLSVARELRRRKIGRIAVIEKGVCGEESSWAAAGMLGPQTEADEGGLFFEMTLASRDLYPDLAAELLAETGVDIELDRSGTLYLAFTSDDVAEMCKRYEWQSAAGLDVNKLTSSEARQAEPFASPDIREALYFAGDWQVENRRLLAALRRYAEVNDITIIEGSTVERFVAEGDQITGVETATGTFSAGHSILATGAWSSLIKLGHSEMPFRVEPVRGQIVAFQTAKRLFNHVVYSRRGYIVPRADGRILAGSTTEFAGFEKAETESAATALRVVAAEISPGIGGLSIIDHWSGLRPYVADGMPVLGSIGGLNGLTIATAHYRNGILLAPLTAHLVADKVIDGVEHAAFTAFGPDRFRFAAGSTR